MYIVLTVDITFLDVDISTFACSSKSITNKLKVTVTRKLPVKTLLINLEKNWTQQGEPFLFRTKKEI